MPSVSPPEVRKRCKLLKKADISDDDLLDYIYDAESYLHLFLSGSYSIPPRPLVYPVGTVTVTKGNNVITGTNTFFRTAKIIPGQHLFIADTNESIVVDTVSSETLLTARKFSFTYPVNNQSVDVVYEPITREATNSQFYIIPEELCTATKYLAAKLALMDHFSEQSYKQGTKAFYEQYQAFADKIIKQIESSDYINGTLVPALPTDSHLSLIKTNTECYRAVIDSRISRINRYNGMNL